MNSRCVLIESISDNVDLINVEPEFVQRRAEASFPGMLLDRPLSPCVSNFAASLGAPDIKRPNLGKVVKVPITQNLLTDPKEFRELPVKRRHIKSTGARALEIAIFEIRDLFSVHIVSETKINLTCTVNLPAVISELTILPP